MIESGGLSVVGAILLAAVTIVNFGTLIVNVKLYTEIMKEKSQREIRP